MVNLAIWGEVNFGAIFTKCGVWVDMVDMGGATGDFWDQRGTGGRSNENDLCVYSRQSLFSTVQVTEFQLP